MNRQPKPSIVCAVLALGMSHATRAEQIAPQRGLNNVRHDQVELEGGFWGTPP